MLSNNNFFIRSSKLASRGFFSSSKALFSYAYASQNTYDDEEIYGAIPFPSERASNNIPGQGWLVETTVKTSLIPMAGKGR